MSIENHNPPDGYESTFMPLVFYSRAHYKCVCGAIFSISDEEARLGIYTRTWNEISRHLGGGDPGRESSKFRHILEQQVKNDI